MLLRPRRRCFALVLTGCLGITAACADDGGGATTPGTGTSTGEASSTSTASTDAGSTGADPTGATSTTPTTGATTTTDPSGGGTGGATGGAGDGPFCQEACGADIDCTASGMDLGYVCESGRCVDPNARCDHDGECYAAQSGWVTPCAAQVGSCVPVHQLCVDIGGGEGRCATAPQMLVACEDIGQVEIVMPTIEGDQDVIVCGNRDFVCQDRTCVDPCESDAECMLVPGHPQCNAGTCECSGDSDCAASGVAGRTRCRQGVCGCGDDADCAVSLEGDVCTPDGTCGCSSADVCKTQVFDGTTPVCEDP